MNFLEARWRLQLVAEMTVGSPLRAAAQADNAKVQRLKEATRGPV